MRTITILMSTYNGGKFIDEQLDSIFHQIGLENYKIKLIIRDDGSTDDTIAIIETWKRKLDIELEIGENIGARNSFFSLLMKAPCSDYYAFCDQDDIWYKDKLCRSIRNLDENSLYFSNIEYIGTDGKPTGEKLLGPDFQIGLKRILMCNPANGCSMVWDQQLHANAVKIPVDTFTMHDEFMCTVAFLFGKLCYDDVPTMGYRLHALNVTQSKSMVKRMKIRADIWLGRKKYSLDKRSKVLLEFELRNEDREVLKELSEYKKGLRRYKIATSYSCEDSGIERSFRARMVLGLL